MQFGKLKNFVNGQWIDPDNSGYIDVENPSTGEIIAQVPLSTKSSVDKAIDFSHEAYLKWKDVPVARRVKYLYDLRTLLISNEDEIEQVLTTEMGKSLPDAQAEMKRAIENIEVACGMPMFQQGDKMIGASFDIDGEVLRLPLGVFTMIAPFNFPGMVPFWFLPYAIASGNTYVVKASKQVPCTMQVITKYIEQTGLPAGVFSLINGDKTVADAFIENPKVVGVSLVGSTRTCREVAAKCAVKNKRFQAMGSAKNHLVVMPDARISEAVRNMITSCYGCAGQRCMAASAIVCVGEKTYGEVISQFVEASKQVIVTNPLDPSVANEQMVMGPVISASAKKTILALIDKGVQEGAKLILDGRNLVVKGYEKGYFIGPTVFVDVKENMEIHKTEIFGPVVIIMKVDSLDEAIRIINDHQYGNGASIYTQNGYWARKFKLETKAGMIGVNIGIPAPVAFLPFGGMKDSQFADIKAQGKAVINFFTEDKVITERYWSEE